MTRQRRWQIKQMGKGHCQSCAKPAQGRAHCDACAKRLSNVKIRRPLKSEWAAVNWNQTNAAIADHFGVTVVAVGSQRRKHTTKGTTHVHPSKNQAG